MGCSGSKVDDLPLVIRCRERKDLIRAAAEHRYALAAAHISYFRSLKGVGDALRKFVEEELVVGASSSSTTTAASSPVVTLHSLDDDEEEEEDGEVKEKKKIKGNSNQGKDKSKSKNLRSVDSGSGDSHVHHNHGHGDDQDSDSHVHLSSDEDSDMSHHHMHHYRSDSEDEGIHAHHDSGPYGNGYGYGMMNEPPPAYGGYGGTNGVPAGYGMMNELPPGYGMTNGPPPEAYWGPFPSYFGMNQPYQAWEPPTYENPSTNFRNTNVYYMKRSSPVMKTVIQEPEPVTKGYSHFYFSQPFVNDGFYGYPMGPNVQPQRGFDGRKPGNRADPPPPPSPKVSTWDFWNPFEAYDSGNAGYFSQYGYGYASSVSSPDSTEVRKREGIPDLEEETETEVYRDVQKGKRVKEDVNRNYSGEGNSGSRPVPLHSEDSSKRVPLRKITDAGRATPYQTSAENNPNDLPSQNSEGSATQMSSSQHYREGSSRALPFDKSEATESINLTESSSDSILSSKSPEEVYVKKKGVSFEVDETLKHEVDSSKLSSLTTLSPHGTRDLREVVTEIRDEFAVASDIGKEVALMLEVGKLPYHPNFIRVILSRILYLMSPSLSTYSVSRRSVRLAAKTMKMAKSYFGDLGKEIVGKPCNLSCTLEKLYAWEKKLYKEVKDEERLRVIYEKLCKRLKALDEQGAESNKIEPVRAAIRKSLTKLNICIKTIASISSRIDKLRDEELQPQVAELIHGLIRMWKSMFRCHQKQFQAIMESKVRALKANTSFEKDSGLRATLELEMELRTWLGHFSNWVSTQKSYVESLNGWLLRCLQYEAEETADGPAPYSPGRLGAPPVFVICNDWNQAMETMSESQVANAMNNFASSLRELWEKQDEEQRQRLKADDLSKDFKNRLKTVHLDKKRTEREQDTMSDKNNVSIVPSDSRVSRLDDLEVDLDTVGKRLAEEKARHKDAKKIVHDAASSSVQGGLVPILKALESFSLEVLKAHEQVRLKNDGQSL